MLAAARDQMTAGDRAVTLALMGLLLVGTLAVVAWSDRIHHGRRARKGAVMGRRDRPRRAPHPKP